MNLSHIQEQYISTHLETQRKINQSSEIKIKLEERYYSLTFK